MEHQTLGQWDDCPIVPVTQRIILKIVGFIIGLNPLWDEFANQTLILILLCNLLNWFLFAETSFCCNLASTLHVAILSWSLLCNNIFYADSLLYYIQLKQKVCNFLIKIGHHDMGTVINPTKYNKEVRWGVSIL